MTQARRPPLGAWIRMSMPDAFIGFVYVDNEAGPSVKGDAEGTPELAARPTTIIRLPMPYPFEVLGDAEVARLGLPDVPTWLEFYGGPAAIGRAPWHLDPKLAGKMHPDFANDLQVIVHDGEPRRTGRAPELCWVRITSSTPRPGRSALYIGTLLNAPHSLETVQRGATIKLVTCEGLPHPLMVSDAYLAERSEWLVQACDKCGLEESLDPPSVMAKTRFPDSPPDAVVERFTAFCAHCGGMQMFVREATRG